MCGNTHIRSRGANTEFRISDLKVAITTGLDGHLQRLIRVVYVCWRTDLPSFDCYNSSASFRNYVSTSGIGSATFFLGRLVILQRGRRSCSLSVRRRSIYQAVGFSGAIYVFQRMLGKPWLQALETEGRKCRS